jgi:hypothetical protein
MSYESGYKLIMEFINSLVSQISAGNALFPCPILQGATLYIHFSIVLKYK